MALVLTFKKGESFFVRDEQVTLTDFNIDRTKGTLGMGGGSVDIALGKATQLFPNVKVTMGDVDDRRFSDQLRLIFDAPKTIPINREDLYYRKKAGPKPPAHG